MASTHHPSEAPIAPKSHPLNRLWRWLGTSLCYLQFGVCTLILSLVFSLLSLLPSPTERKKNWIRATVSRSCRFYLNTMSSLGLIRYSIQPEHRIQPQGKLIIANHPTLLDAFFILGMCDNLCCITKSALWKNPFTAAIVRMADYIANDSEDFIEQAQQRLNAGESLLIFPEGTRNHYDHQLDFKRGAANIALRAQCELLPMVIHCRPRAMQKGEKWYRTPASVPHFSLETLAAIRPQEHINTQAPITLQYRQLTAYLREFYRPLLTTGSPSETLSEDRKKPSPYP